MIHANVHLAFGVSETSMFEGTLLNMYLYCDKNRGNHARLFAEAVLDDRAPLARTTAHDRAIPPLGLREGPLMLEDHLAFVQLVCSLPSPRSLRGYSQADFVVGILSQLEAIATKDRYQSIRGTAAPFELLQSSVESPLCPHLL